MTPNHQILVSGVRLTLAIRLLFAECIHQLTGICLVHTASQTCSGRLIAGLSPSTRHHLGQRPQWQEGNLVISLGR